MTWAEVKAYALEEYTAGRIAGKEYSSFVLGALQTQMQIDSDAGIKTAQIAATTAQIAATAAQSAATTAQTAINQAQSAKDLLVKDAQIASQNAQKLVYDRQVVGFADNLRVKKAETLTNAAGMFGAGGLSNASFESAALTAANSI